MNRQLGLLANAQCLFNRLQQTFTFITNVAGVQSAMRCHHTCQRNNLFRRCVRARNVHQTGRHSPSTLAHATCHQSLHLFQFCCCRRTFTGPHNPTPQTALRNQVHHIHARTVLFHLAQIVRHVEFATTAIPRHDRRTTLRQIIAGESRLGFDNAAVTMVMQIDETGSHDLAATIDDQLRATLKPPDGDDPVSLDRQIPGYRRISSTISEDSTSQ